MRGRAGDWASPGRGERSRVLVTGCSWAACPLGATPETRGPAPSAPRPPRRLCSSTAESQHPSPGAQPGFGAQPPRRAAPSSSSRLLLFGSTGRFDHKLPADTARVCPARVPAPGHTRVPRLPCTPARPDDAPPAGHRPPRRWSPAQSGFPVTSSGLWVVVRSASDFQIGGRRPGSFLFLLCSRVPERSENMAFWSLDASVLALLFTVGGLVVGGLAQARAPSPGAPGCGSLRAACSPKGDVGPLPSEGRGGMPPPHFATPACARGQRSPALRTEARQGGSGRARGEAPQEVGPGAPQAPVLPVLSQPLPAAVASTRKAAPRFNRYGRPGEAARGFPRPSGLAPRGPHPLKHLWSLPSRSRLTRWSGVAVSGHSRDRAKRAGGGGQVRPGPTGSARPRTALPSLRD